MTVIRQDDVIQSVADALQYISYYHPKDFIDAMAAAYEREENPAAKDAIAQILINSRMCATGHRPICQDTGIVTVFVHVGMNVTWDAELSLDDMINEGVRRAYQLPDNVLRASVLADPDGKRQNTKDNTPAIIHHKIVPGDKVDIHVAAKGGGSEAKSKFAMLNPSDSVVDWVMEQLPKMGAGWCPPGMLGIGIGGTAEKAMEIAKEALLDPIDIQELQARGASNRAEELRLELFDKVNKSGIGAQGLGGLTTVLGDNVKRVNLDTVTPEEVKTWQPGDTLLLNGKLLTGRDAAHKRMVDMIAKGEPLPVDMKGRFIYYVGPVDPVGNEVVGPAGPTTATRMDKFTRTMLEETGLLGMVGKAERGQAAIEAIRDNQAVYLMAVGGSAYLVAQAIKKSRVVGFEDLGMEAIYEFAVEDMPVTVAVDSQGTSVHQTGPAKWKEIIAEKA